MGIIVVCMCTVYAPRRFAIFVGFQLVLSLTIFSFKKIPSGYWTIFENTQIYILRELNVV